MNELQSILDFLIGKPDGNVKGELCLAGAADSYSIYQFNVSFSQSVDQYGEPQTESSGGQMLVSIHQLPDNTLLAWAAGSRILKNGEIVFRNETESASMRILFENAYCTSFKVEVDKGSSCSFIISPEKISINGELLDNEW